MEPQTQGRPGQPRVGGGIKHAPQLRSFRPPENVSDLAWKNVPLGHGQKIEPEFFREENIYFSPTVMPLVGKLIRREPVNTEELKTMRYLLKEAAKEDGQINPVVYDLLGGEVSLAWCQECLSPKKATPAGATATIPEIGK